MASVTARDIPRLVVVTPISQRQLVHEAWGPEYQQEITCLRQYMAQLRRKLEEDAARPRHLITEPSGMGYRYRP